MFHDDDHRGVTGTHGNTQVNMLSSFRVCVPILITTSVGLTVCVYVTGRDRGVGGGSRSCRKQVKECACVGWGANMQK